MLISLFYMLRTDLKKHICGPQLVDLTTTQLHHTADRTASPPADQVRRTDRLPDRSPPDSAKFLFIPDITRKATGVVLVVLLVLYIRSQLGSTMMMSATADPTSAG